MVGRVSDGPEHVDNGKDFFVVGLHLRGSLLMPSFGVNVDRRVSEGFPSDSVPRSRFGL
jgi:hypothetical protein